MDLRSASYMLMVIMRNMIRRTWSDWNGIREAIRRDRAELIKSQEEFKKSIYGARQNPPLLKLKPKKEKTGMLFFMRKRMELQAQIETLSLTIKNKEEEFRIQSRAREAEYDQTFKNREAEFQRQITKQNNDYKIMESNLKDDLERTKKILDEKHQNKVDEVTGLMKLEAEQKIAKAQLDAEKRIASVENGRAQEISSLKASHAENIAKVKQEEAQQNYERMTAAFTDMNKNGSIQTKQQHEMVMTLLQHARPGVNESRFLTGRIDGQPGNDLKTIVTDGQSVNAVIVE